MAQCFTNNLGWLSQSLLIYAARIDLQDSAAQSQIFAHPSDSRSLHQKPCGDTLHPKDCSCSCGSCVFIISNVAALDSDVCNKKLILAAFKMRIMKCTLRTCMYLVHICAHLYTLVLFRLPVLQLERRTKLYGIPVYRDTSMQISNTIQLNIRRRCIFYIKFKGKGNGPDHIAQIPSWALASWSCESISPKEVCT